MREHNLQKLRDPVELTCLIGLAVIALVGGVDVIRYALLGRAVPLLSVCVVEVLFILTATVAWRSRLPILFLAVGVFALVLGINTNYLETTLFNLGFFVQAAAAILTAAIGTVLTARHHVRPCRPAWGLLITALVVLAGSLAIWLGGTAAARSASAAAREIWAVPSRFDAPCEQAGTVELLTYQTKAYATDQREVEKSANVYLPYGYDDSRQYNILYLMHGTGDDENYWLLTHPQNKNMVDQLIAQDVIDPLIIVTPTFYVEDDCADGLDPLTYSFAQELRNDLMPAVESRYHTYADSCKPEGFIDSRDHRAFAGLSRGAVTTYHSVLCGSLDYFSWFGTFSGCRTSADYFVETLQSDEFASYPIHYLYASSGTFDFALPQQIQDYHGLLSVEPRLTEGENTAFDVYPMRYHSIGNWHLALYNYLQRIF